MSLDFPDGIDHATHPGDLTISGFHPAISDTGSGTQRLVTTVVRKPKPATAPIWPWCAGAGALCLGLILLSRVTFPTTSDAIISAQVTILRAPEDGYLVRFLTQTGSRLASGSPLVELHQDRQPVDLEVLQTSLDQAVAEVGRLTHRQSVIHGILAQLGPDNRTRFPAELASMVRDDGATLASGDPVLAMISEWSAADRKPSIDQETYSRYLARSASILPSQIDGARLAEAVARKRIERELAVSDDRTTILRSPFSGTVVSRTPTLGVRLLREDEILAIADDSTIMVVASFPNHARIAAGSPCMLRLMTGGESVSGWIEELPESLRLTPKPYRTDSRILVAIRLADPTIFAPRLGERVKVMVGDHNGMAHRILHWLAQRIWM